MTQAQDPIAAAMAAAEARKNAATAQLAAGVPATQGTAPGGAVAVAQPAQKLSMETLAAGSMNVDNWLKVKEFGLLIGDDKTLIQTLKVALDMTEGVGFMPKKSIKYGNPVEYKHTYDGVNAADGGTWEQAVAVARSVSPTAREYRSVDLPFILLEDAKGPKDVVICPKGQRLGHSTATTNWAAFEAFYREVAAAGLLGKMVEIELGYESKTNKNSQSWGVITFKLIGEVQEEDAE